MHPAEIEAKSPVTAPMPVTDVSESPMPDEVTTSTLKLRYKEVNEVYVSNGVRYDVASSRQLSRISVSLLFVGEFVSTPTSIF